MKHGFIKVGAVSPDIAVANCKYNKDKIVEAVKNAKVPVIFFHGEADDFVPCEMSKINYEACSSKKMLVTVAGAGHGLSFPVAPEKYLNALRDFFGKEGSYQEK
jgi:fermentation-respiration switch protein FrsA (DUF1100 family)